MQSGPMIPMIERLAKAGFALHWLHPKSKRPIGNDWANKPVASLSDLKRTYRDGNNVGVRLGKWSVVGDLFLHIIDFDIRKPEMVEAARQKLLELFPGLDLETCPTVLSGSGAESRHFYFLSDVFYPSRKFAHSDGFELVWDESKQRDVKKWDWELHLLGTGSQAVIPPSIHPDTGKPYRWLRELDFDLLELGIGPIYDSFQVAAIASDRDDLTEPNSERQQPLGLSEDEIVAVLDDLPPEEWFEDRDQWYRVGMALHHETDGSDFGFDLWCKYSSSSEKFDEKDQRRVWRSFKGRAQAPFRMASLVAVVREVRAERQLESIDDDFDEVDEVDPDSTDMFDDLLGAGKGPKKLTRKQLKLKKEEVEFELGHGAPKNLAKINTKHAVARVSSKTVILDIKPDKSVSYGSVADLHSYYENDRVPKDGTTEPVTKAWMRSKHRRSYPNGIVFAPNRTVEGAYNHWQGFSVEPDETKSCKLFLKHLLEIFCDGNPDHYFYMLGWLAHMIQKPEEKPGVAIVAIGAKRIGKDSVAEYVGGLFPHHHITVGNQDQMLGKFNAHQERCLLLQMQEGFWAGDKKAEGQLKYLVTSTAVMIEPKGMNAFPIQSVLRLFISSNERWVIPATQDEGRFFVVNVSSKRRNDHKYFAALRDEMNNGGREKLLHFLLTYDISGFQVRAVPNTVALAEQKVEGLKNLDRWWHGLLQHGGAEGDVGLMTEKWWERAVQVEKGEFRSSYARWMRYRRYDGDELSEVAFTRQLKKLCPDLEDTRTTKSGGPRQRFFVVPPLDVCRSAFEKVMGSELPWPQEGSLTETDDDYDDLDTNPNPQHTLTI